MTLSTCALRELDLLRGLPDETLAWLLDRGETLHLPAGARMFERGQPADFMFIVVRGVIEGFEEVAGQELLVATTRAGQVTGMLPFSRMRHYPRYTVAAEDSVVLRLPKAVFADMVVVSYELGQRLVAEMSNRVRGDVRLEQQHERMAALGRLAAGLAHELNNPAAAVGRAARGLADELGGAGDLVSRLMHHDVEPMHVEAIDRLRRVAGEHANDTMSPLERSEREETLGAWLERRDVPGAWTMAGTLTDAGLGTVDLERFEAAVPRGLRSDALQWVACGVSVQRIVDEIRSAATHISDLVSSVKTYSHMDRSPEHRPTDVREGLENTLRLLDHKVRTKNIRLHRDYAPDTPTITGHAGELNQVWTNLIDNAVDAVEDGGRLDVSVRRHGRHLHVDIVDDGPGIPTDIRGRVFEPFFTTKPVGEGTGLGLDIAQRIVRTHRGTIVVTSRPGQTRMCVRLPV